MSRLGGDAESYGTRVSGVSGTHLCLLRYNSPAKAMIVEFYITILMNLSDNVNRDSAQVCRFVNDVLHSGRRRPIPIFSKES